MEMNFEPDYRNSSFSVKDPLGRTPLQVGIEVAIAVLICLACIAGNVTVVIAIHKTPRLKTVTNMLVENLAWDRHLHGNTASAILDYEHEQWSLAIKSRGL